VAAFGGDAATVAARITADEQERAALQGQIDDLNHKIEQDHNYEMLGWLLGPIGYVIASELGSLIDDQQGLEQRIQQIRETIDADSRSIQTLAAVSGQLGTLLGLADNLMIGLTALSSGITVLGDQLAGARDAALGIEPGNPFDIALVDALEATCKDLGVEVITLLGPDPAPRQPHW
jgi:hypothetical protein